MNPSESIDHPRSASALTFSHSLDQLPFNNLRNPLDPTQSIRSFSFDEVQALSEKKHRGT